MWGWKRQKIPPAEPEEEIDLSEIIPKVVLAPIIVPKRLSRRRTGRGKSPSGRKKQSMDQRYHVDMGDIHDLNDILKTHK